VAVVPTDRVLPSLRSWLDGTVGVDTANTVVVTGPSRTADIEGVLVRGVHGPGEVHVVLVH
jgi:L-lactate dehydrogenase complex protein LldG